MPAQQLARERIDDTIDALERHRLALVAPPRQDQRAAALRFDLLDEALRERTLADAALSLDEHRHGRARDHLVERVVEYRELGRSTDERLRALLGELARCEPRADRRRGRTLRRIATEQFHAQPRELAIGIRRWQRIFLLLAD